MLRLALLLMVSWATPVASFADSTATVLAPGYGALEYAPPTPGSYALPPLGPAADGNIVLSDGQEARLHDLFGDKLVLLSFIYSTCSDVNGCPLATFVLHQIAGRLAGEPSISEQLRFVSLSFDPEHDTPEVMALYARSFRSAEAEWVFATTRSATELAPILDAYGQHVQKAYGPDGEDTGVFAHLLRVLLIDRAGQVRNVYSVSFLHPDVLVNDVRTLLMSPEEGGAPALVAASETAGVSSYLGPGDPRQGYESAGYTTQASSVAAREGQPADLVALAESPGLGLPPVPVPAQNPITPRKVALGRQLFFDRRLSLNDTISCAMCHIPEQGFTSNELATSIGFEGRTVRRNAPTLYNVAFLPRLFHDGREISLENQVWAPLLAANEMANPSIGAVIDKLRHIPDYAGLFEAAFEGRGPTLETIGMAIASYERTLNAADSPFDRWYYGGEPDAIDEAAKRGFALFTGEAGCASCHTLAEDFALFTDGSLHHTGVGWRAAMSKEPPKRTVQLAPGVFVEVETDLIRSVGEPPPSDLGLYEITQNPADRWRYRTPNLRNVALTAPYMHDGSMSTLEAVVRFYNAGGFANDLQDPRIRPLNLADEQVREVVAFLRSLTSDRIAVLVADAFAAPIGDLGPEDPHWSHKNRIEY